MGNLKSIVIDGQEYMPVNTTAKRDGLPYVMCRTEKAGVFAGYLESREGNEAKLLDARRIWYWAGAASLSELAQRGTSDPSNCKFPMPVSEVILIGVIEIIPITEQAQASIEAVAIWTE